MTTKKILLFLLLLGVFLGKTLSQCPPSNLSNLLRGEASVCALANTGKIYIHNPDGKYTVTEWFHSPDNNTWLSAENPGKDTLVFSNLSQTQYYRATVEYTGCSDNYTTNSITITVYSPSKAGTISGVSKGCRYTHSGTLSLLNYTGDILNWLVYDTLTNRWDPLSNTSPQHNFTNLSTETLYKAVVKNGTCPTDTSAVARIGVYLLPEVAFNTPSDCFGKEMQFRENVQKANEPDNYVNAYHWNFDDGTSSVERNPLKTYTNVRSYSVSLKASTNQGCQSSLTQNIDVYPLPLPSFITKNVCLGTESHFQNTSTLATGTLSHFQWSFGDLQTDTLKNPAHLYTQSQSYQVDLLVTSAYGCTAQTTQTVQVYKNPIARFSADSVCSGKLTQFTNYSSAEEGVLGFFRWDFGDETSSLLQHPTHSFLQSHLTTQLYIETDKGCKDSISNEVVVYPLPKVDFDIINACDGNTVRFNNQSTAEEGIITSYLWNLGDGATSSQVNPEKLYFNPGTYLVNLSALTSDGCENNLQKKAIVFKNPVADFTVKPACFNTPVDLLNRSFIAAGESLIYEWDLGDGTSSTLSNLQHTYPQAGDYIVHLTVSSDQGKCRDSIKYTATVFPLPSIDAGKDLTGSLGYGVPLAATGGTQYQWYPSEGLLYPNTANPIATPTQTTTYTVQGTDAHGCVNYDSVQLSIVEDNKIIPTNLITPDGNGKNDTWLITNIGNYPQALIQIYNVHGQEIFTAENYQNNWDGRNKNGDILPDGTYYYIITLGENERLYKGALTVLRNH